MSRPTTDTLLRKGDPITIVYRGAGQCILLLTYVTMRYTGGEAIWIEVQFPRALENLDMADEGRGWVRGHHLIDSPVIDAARVAQGL